MFTVMSFITTFKGIPRAQWDELLGQKGGGQGRNPPSVIEPLTLWGVKGGQTPLKE